MAFPNWQIIAKKKDWKKEANKWYEQICCTLPGTPVYFQIRDAGEITHIVLEKRYDPSFTKDKYRLNLDIRSTKTLESISTEVYRWGLFFRHHEQSPWDIVAYDWQGIRDYGEDEEDEEYEMAPFAEGPLIIGLNHIEKYLDEQKFTLLASDIREKWQELTQTPNF